MEITVGDYITTTLNFDYIGLVVECYTIEQWCKYMNIEAREGNPRTEVCRIEWLRPDIAKNHWHKFQWVDMVVKVEYNLTRLCNRQNIFLERL